MCIALLPFDIVKTRVMKVLTLQSVSLLLSEARVGYRRRVLLYSCVLYCRCRPTSTAVNVICFLIKIKKTYTNTGLVYCTPTVKLTVGLGHVALWIGQTIIFSSRGFFFFILLFSSPNLSRRRLDVCHTSTHGMALVVI